MRAHLLLLVSAVLLPVLGFAGVAVWRVAETERGRIEHRAGDAARQAAAALDRELGGIVAAARILAASESLEAGDLAAFHRRTVEAKQAIGAAAITLQDAASRQIVNADIPWGTPLPGDTRLAREDARAAETGGPVFSNVFAGLSGGPQFSVVLPLPPSPAADDDAPRFLSLAAPLSRVQSILEREVSLEPGMAVGVMDRAGAVVARTADPGRGAEGEPAFLASRVSRLTGWRVDVSVPEAVLDAPRRRALLSLAGLGAGALTLALLAALLVGRRLTGAVRALAAAGDALLRGEPVPAVRTALREADEVGAALADAAREQGESEARLRAAVEGSPFPIMLHADDGEVLALSRSWTELSGYAAEEIPTHFAWFRLAYPDAHEAALATLEREFAAGQVTPAGEVSIRTRSGAQRTWNFQAVPLGALPDGRRLQMSAAVDVTERNAAEARLEQLLSERTAELARRDARLGAWFTHASEHLFALTVTPDGRFVFEGLNPAHEQATGLSSAALRGRTPSEVLPPAIAAVLEANYRRCVEARAPVHYEEDLTLPAGRKRWETSLVPVQDPGTGRVELILGSARDVTEQRRMQAREAQGQRLEALGQLAGGIAHDFNNVMQAVEGGAGLIRRRAADPQAVDHLARMVEDAARRGASVTRRLLAFARRGELRAEAVDPAGLLADLQEVLAHTLGPDIDVRVEAGPGLPPLRADKGQLETVLVNLATNARDAMPRGGALVLSAAAEIVEPGRVHAANLLPGSYVRLMAYDTGEGMAAEVLARASEPFFTTKPQGKGTGLGLAMARGFAEQSGGAFAIRSAPGAGTAVTLWLPAAEGAVPAGPGRAGGERAPPAPRRVLVVDDEDLVREVLAEALEERGYASLRAGDAGAALAMLDAGAEVDLLLTDYAMPGTDGLSLVAEARRRRPGLPAVVLTGHAGDQLQARLAVGGVGSGPFSLLRKPVGGDELAECVGALLERAEAKA